MGKEEVHMNEIRIYGAIKWGTESLLMHYSIDESFN